MPFVAKNPNQNFFWIPLNSITNSEILAVIFFNEILAVFFKRAYSGDFDHEIKQKAVCDNASNEGCTVLNIEQSKRKEY